jgi:hypothetical protein
MKKTSFMNRAENPELVKDVFCVNVGGRKNGKKRSFAPAKLLLLSVTLFGF